MNLPGLSRVLALIAVTAVCLLSLPSYAQESLNLYTTRHYDSDRMLYADFSEKTGIVVNVVQAGGNELLQRIAREGRNSPADILLAADAAVIGRAQAANLFRSVKSAALEAAIPPHLRDPNGQWFGFTMRGRVIMYNKEKVKPQELSTYEDLADRKWKGRLLINSSNVTYNQSLVASMIVEHGVAAAEVWAKGLVANMARAPKGADTDLINALYAGEADVALANTYYLGNLIRNNPEMNVLDKVGVFFPNQTGEGAMGRGAHINVSAGGVTKYAPHAEAAVKFLEFLATPEAQKVFAEGNSEYPVVAGVEPAERVKAFGSFKPDQVNVGLIGKNNIEAVRLMDRAGWL